MLTVEMFEHLVAQRTIIAFTIDGLSNGTRRTHLPYNKQCCQSAPHSYLCRINWYWCMCERFFFFLVHILQSIVKALEIWASSANKIFHSHSLSISMRVRNSRATVCLGGRSTGINSWTWLILWGEQCRILDKILFIVFTGLFKDRRILLSLHVCTPLFVDSYNTVDTLIQNFDTILR